MKGYTITGQQYLKEQGCMAYLYRHDYSGAKVLYMSNPKDDNKVFCISFCTPPEDNCGTPHILEHTVLNGSDKFPLKDPFMQLGKGSLNTFLNAMTFPDKTMYPVASQNDTDFMTLMDVYLDAVFHPFILKSNKPLMQEGWHYVPTEDGRSVTVKGVVYNEMKGAFSSSEEVLMREIKRRLNPDNAYQFESGGIPDEIPDLSYEKYLDYYNRHYQAANSYVFFYGNGDMEKHLAFLDENYLSKMPDTGLTYSMEAQKPFTEPRFETDVFASADENEKPYFSYSVQCGTVTDPLAYYATDILEYMLLETEGAPLKEALQEEEFGEDIFGYVDNSLLNPMLSIVVKGADPDKEARFVPRLKEICSEIIEKGFNREMIEGALNSYEFRLREADSGSAPTGLFYLITALQTWLHGESPFTLLQYDAVFRTLREKVEEGYFENLLKELVLDNPHGLSLTLKADPEWNARRDARNEAEWKAYFEGLSKEEQQALIDADKELEAFQNEPETEEALQSIPLLDLNDIERQAVRYPYTKTSTNGVDTLVYKGFTNGIAYIKLLFDLKMVQAEDLPYVNLLAEVLGSMNTREKTYEQLGNLTNIHTGGIGMSVRTAAETNDGYGIWFQIIGKCFYREIGAMLSLILEQLKETDFSDTSRLEDILQQTLSRVEMQMQSSGHTIAMNRAKANLSRTAAAGEYIGGTIYYDVLSDLVEHFEEKKEELVERFKRILNAFVDRNGLLVHITAEESEEQKVRAEISKWLPAVPRSENPLPAAEPVSLMKGKVGLLSSSMVQYVASVGAFKEPYNGKMLVLRSILSQDYLWDQIRVHGGAYGCMTAPNRRGQWYIVSYRDPNLKESLEVYRKAAEYVQNFRVSDREMTKYIIGTISDISQPQTVSLKGARSLDLYLNHMSDDELQKLRDDVLSTTQEDIRSMAGLVREITENAQICVFGNAEKLKASAELFDEMKEMV